MYDKAVKVLVISYYRVKYHGGLFANSCRASTTGLAVFDQNPFPASMSPFITRTVDMRTFNSSHEFDSWQWAVMVISISL
jgi:hypothetical protein